MEFLETHTGNKSIKAIWKNDIDASAEASKFNDDDDNDDSNDEDTVDSENEEEEKGKKTAKEKIADKVISDLEVCYV